QPRQGRAKIEPCLGGADAGEVVDPPDHAGRTEIEARVAVTNSFIERVRGPESLRVEMLKAIHHDVLDRGFGLALVPGNGSQRHVTGRFDHAVSIARERKCDAVVASAAMAP